MRLPLDIISQLVDLLTHDEQSLSTLSHGSDWRCFVLRFRHEVVKIDYSQASQRLCLELGREAYLDDPAKKTCRFLIGPCVRRLVVAPRKNEWRACHREWYDWATSRLVPANLPVYIPPAQQEILQELRKSLLAGLEHAMPNLEVLVLQRGIAFPVGFFELLSRTSITHLYLENVDACDMNELQPKLTTRKWPLRSLHLDLDDAAIDRNYAIPKRRRNLLLKKDIRPFVVSLLRLVAPTLEELYWPYAMHLGDGRRPLKFPELQLLRLPNLSKTAYVSSPLLAPTLRHLETSYDKVACGPRAEYRQLESLVTSLPEDTTQADTMADFIRRHPNLQKLSVTDPGRTATDGSANVDDNIRGVVGHIERCIVPLLANGCFRNLTSLSLGFRVIADDRARHPGPMHISSSTLAAIGTLTSLKRLRLSGPNEWHFHLQLNHLELRDHLQKLNNLQVLMLERAWIGPPVEMAQNSWNPVHVRQARARLAALDASPETARVLGYTHSVNAQQEQAQQEEILRLAWQLCGDAETEAIQQVVAVLPSSRLLLWNSEMYAVRRDSLQDAARPRIVRLLKTKAMWRAFELGFEISFGVFASAGTFEAKEKCMPGWTDDEGESKEKWHLSFVLHPQSHA
jgi:hypothetical protein